MICIGVLIKGAAGGVFAVVLCLYCQKGEESICILKWSRC